MFEIHLKVLVENKDGHPGATKVENILYLDGVEQKKHSDDFRNVFEAYMFVGDYFYGMVEELAVKSGLVTAMLDSVAGKSDLN